MAKKLKPVELFLSLGLVASLATACGGPTEGGDATEADEAETTESVEEAPAAESAEEAPDAESEEEAPDAESEEGGEGGEGGEG